MVRAGYWCSTQLLVTLLPYYKVQLSWWRILSHFQALLYKFISCAPHHRLIWFDLLCLAPLSATFQLYHGDQFYCWRKPEYPERNTDHGQATGKLYHLRVWVEYTLFVVYKAGREPTSYWLKACTSCYVIQLPNSLSHPGPSHHRSSNKVKHIHSRNSSKIW